MQALTLSNGFMKGESSRMPKDEPGAADLAIDGFGESVEHMIDARGLLCPEPLMIVRNHVRKMAAGERVAIVATDPSTRRDFADFCRFMGHELVVDQARAERFEFVIRKSVQP